MPELNEYFDGAVKSLALDDRGRAATVGVMEPGSYEFGTGQRETMRVLVGVLEVQLPGAVDFTAYPAGSEFEVPAHVRFKVRLETQVAYLCHYD